MSAFPIRAEEIGTLVSQARLDIQALNAPLLPCDLAKCRGTCCHDGVYLSGEEADVIRDICQRDSEFFADQELELPRQVVVYGRFRDTASGPKTATKPFPMARLVDDYPEHFADTQCVFLLPDARCSLQVLAESKGLESWDYKPFTCWIHPLSFAKDKNSEDVLLTLHSYESDPHRFEDYDGFSSKTHCGRACESPLAKPAFQVLEKELKQLGELADRDLVGEIKQAIA